MRKGIVFSTPVAGALVAATTLFAASVAHADPKNCPKVDKATGAVVIPADKNLAGCNLERADLSGADLSGANLEHANLNMANLSGATLSAANLEHANLDHSDLTGACLYQANLTHANIDHSSLNDANLSEATLVHANLDHADVTGANLSGADLTKANTNHANLAMAIFNSPGPCAGAMCHPVAAFSDNFSGAALSSDWLTAPDLVSAPFIQNGQACGHTQSFAGRCVTPASSERIEFDFNASTPAGRETYAIFSEGLPGSGDTYTLGCNGGFSDTCGLEIRSLGGGALAGPVLTPAILANHTYHLVATLTASGLLSLTVLDGGTVVGQLSANVEHPVSSTIAGFITGRDPNGTTCVDNFVYTSTP